MKIAMLTHDDSANAYYRAHLPMRELQRRGRRVEGAWIRGPREVPTVAALREFDVVYVWRLFYEPIWRLARQLRAAGVAVVWDNDDDIVELPKSSPAYVNYGGSRARRTLFDITAMMRAAHVVTAPSEALVERLSRLRGAAVELVENYLPGILERGNRAPGPLAIGWTASMEHRQDWDKLALKSTIARLMDEHPGLAVKSIGLRLGYRSDRYEHAQRVAADTLLHYVAHFDIAIAPLLDIPFNRARSSIKLKEYAAAGVPWVASDVGPYRGMGERQGGVLVAEDGWHSALERLIKDEALRRHLAANGRRWASSQVIQVNGQRWERVFEKAVKAARSAPVAG